MGRLTHIYEPGATYLITTVTCRRQRIFENAACAQAAHDDITFYAAKFKTSSLAHVIMPDHIHWIICPSSEDFARFAREEQARGGKYAGAPGRFYLSKIMEDYKRHTAFSINKLLGTPGAQVWQDGFRDDALRGPQAIRAAIKYVVMNPVKAALVEKSEEYPYLSWLMKEIT